MEQVFQETTKRKRSSKSGNKLFVPRSTGRMFFSGFLKLVIVLGVIYFVLSLLEGSLLGWNDYVENNIIQNAGKPEPIQGVNGH